jgi:twitching motility protein PilT
MQEVAVAEIDKFLKMGRQLGASDIHIGVGSPPMLRLHGALRKIKYNNLTPEDTKRLLYEIMSEKQRKHFEEHWELDMSYASEEAGRCRTNICLQNRGIDATLRLIPTDLRTLDELGFPPVVKKLLEYRQGMILVTGQAGCGKTTTLAAMVQHLDLRRSDHTICLEDPIEILHQTKKMHVIQREVGQHTESFARALRACLREDPDVIIVGEMRDLETVSMAITAAETGHLVLGTLHTTNAGRTIGRILDVFPPSQQDQIRTMVADSLRGIISQQLVPTLDGKGRVVCVEVLVVTPAMANLIKEDRTFQIPSMMQTGIKEGMQLMDDGLYKLLQQGVISPETALERAFDRSKFTDLTKMREHQVNWDEFQTLLEDKLKKKKLTEVGVVQVDRKTKHAKPIRRERVPFLFYQTKHGKLPEDAIWAELTRLYPEVAAEPAAEQHR